MLDAGRVSITRGLCSFAGKEKGAFKNLLLTLSYGLPGSFTSEEAPALRQDGVRSTGFLSSKAEALLVAAGSGDLGYQERRNWQLTGLSDHCSQDRGVQPGLRAGESWGVHLAEALWGACLFLILTNGDLLERPETADVL